jgi:hypothetical protein
MAPIQAELQTRFVWVGVAVNVGGETTFTVIVFIQSTLFVTVMVYIPAQSPVADAAVPPLGAHE